MPDDNKLLSGWKNFGIYCAENIGKNKNQKTVNQANEI